MTAAGGFRRPADDGGIRISMNRQVPVGAGQTVDIPVLLVHDGPAATSITLSVLGLDPRWIPPPATVDAVAAGETVELVLRIPVERGALAARYPFVVAAQTAAVAGGRPRISVAESELVVDAQERLVLAVRPQQPIAVFRRRFDVTVTNPGHEPRTVSLRAQTAAGAGISLDKTQLELPAGRTATVGGRLSVRRPRLFGSDNTYPFSVSGRATGAPQTAEGVFRSRPLIRGWLSGLVAVATVLALWAALGLVVLPRLSDQFAGTDAATAAQEEVQQSRQSAAAQSASDAAASSAAASSAAADAAAGGSATDGAAPAPDTGGGTAGGTGTGGNSRLAGSVESGTDPGGTTVIVQPTTVVQAQQQDGQPVQGLVAPETAQALRDSTAIGKVWGSALRTAPGDEPVAAPVTTTTAEDGTWSFAGLAGPGFYLLTFARAGYQTQRFVVDSALLGSADPMKVALVPGQGSLSGQVTSPTGLVGAATVAITDGTTTLTTSTVSTGPELGTWKVDGLATPGDYLITVTAAGFGTESAITSLPAGGTAVTDLDLQTGVASITGQASGEDQFGNVGGLGGLTVTAVFGDVTRTATTITSGAIGRFALPDLPTPGDYTLTVSGPGYQSQTQQVALAAGAGNAEVPISMTRADGVVAGTVLDEIGAGLAGAGLTLTGADDTFKTMSASSPAGAYRFTGVLPGLYVLSASMYGRQTAFATVQITAAETVTSNLVLPLSTSGEVPADSRIRGRAVDNRSAGPLTCDRVPVPVPDCRATVTTVMTTLNGVQQTITTTATPAGDYTLPALDDADHPGLLPGLYALTFTAPGFEPQTITVQVAQSQIVAAPQVSMQPLGMISGQVTAVVGTPAAPTCVIAAASTVTLPDSCTVVPADPADPAAIPTCTAGDAEVRCALTDASGNFELRGFRSGGYVARAVPTDPEYLPTEVVPIQLAVSEVKQFAPVLNRKGRLVVTVSAPDDVTGSVGLANGVTVEIVPYDPALPVPPDFPTPPLQTKVTGADPLLDNQAGTVMFTGLPDGRYDIRVSGGPRNLSGRAQSTPVGINQETPAAVIAAPTYPAVVGRVMTVVDGVVQPLANATVRLSGTVTIGTSNGLLPGSAMLTTDANGCYAVVSTADADAVPTSAECPAGVSGPARGGMVYRIELFGLVFEFAANLAVRTVDVVVTDQTIPPRTQPFQAVGLVAAEPPQPGGSYTIGTLTIAAQPVALGSWAVQTDFAQPGLAGTGAAVTVTRRPAASGNVTVTLLGNGVLSVKDDQLAAQDVLIPGLYQLHAVALGYLAADADLWCGLGQPCRLLPFGTVDPASPPTATQPPSDPNALTLRRVGLMTGTITLPAGGPQTPLSFTSVQVVRTPSDAGAITVQVAPNGTVLFADARYASLGQPAGLATPGEYQFILNLSGYNPTTLRVACDSGDSTRGGRCYQITDQQTGPSQACIADPNQCNALSVTLASLPSFAATVVTNKLTLPNGTPVDRTQVSIAVTQQAVASSVITVTVNADGTVNWRDQSLDPVAQLANTIQAGSYTITASLPGFLATQATYPFTCSSGTCGPGEITLRSLPRPVVTVVADPTTNGLDFPSALISITARPSGTGGLSGTAIPEPAAPGTATITWNDTALPYAGIVSPGEYQFRINLAGYQQSGLLTLGCPASNTASDCTLSGPGVAGSTVTLNRFPLLVGGTWSVAPADSSVRPTIQVTAAPSGAGPITVLALADGTLSWTEAGLPPNLVRPGPYQLAISANGYDTRSYPFNCEQGPTCDPPDLALTKSGLLTLTLVSSRAGNAPANGATVTLSGTNVPSNTVTLASTENSVSFANISAVDPAAFTVRVQTAGFAFTTVTATSPATTVTCSGSVGDDLPGLRVQPGDTECIIKLTQRGRLTGTTLGVSSGPGGPVTDELSQVLITAQRTAPVTDPALAPVRSNPDGSYLLTGTNVVDGMLDGTWSVTASRTGFVNATGTVTVTNGLITAVTSPTGDLQLNQAAQTVDIRLAVQPVNFRVQVRFGTTDVTSNVQLALSDSSFRQIALCAATQAASISCTLPVAPTTFFEFTSINPGVYNLAVTSSTYRGLTTSVSIVAGQAVQSTVINLSSGSSTVTGTAISSVTSSAVVGATVDLVTEASPDTPAPSTNPGVLLTTTTRAASTDPPVTAGSYELANVPDKRYQVRITAPGFETWRSPFFEAQAALDPNIAVQQATLVRSSRVVTVTLVSSAAGAPSFSGASISLTPDPDSGPGFPGTALSGTVGDGNVATISNVPTGTYTVRAVTLPGARPFSAGLYSTTAEVGASPPPSPPPVPVTLTIDETPVTFAATLAGGSCVTAIPPSLTASVTRTSPALTQQISMPVTGTTATSGVTYLPTAGYSWNVVTTGAASFWTSPTQTFTTAGSALTPSIGLQPSLVPVPATMTLNNSPANAVSLQPVAPPGAGVTAPATNLTNGTGTMCLTPGVQWTIAPTGPTVYIDASQQLTPTVATPGSYSYVAQALAPTVALQAVPGRTVDARTVTLALFSGSATTGTPLFSVPLSMPAGTTTASPPNTVYAPGGSYTWAATPAATDVYAAGSTPVALPGNGTAALASTVTLNYNRVVATISVTRGGVAQAGAAVTITAGTVTRTGNSAGVDGDVTLYDVPTGAWTVTAQYVDTSTNPDTTYRGTLTPAVSPAASPNEQSFGPIVLTVVP